MSGSHGPSDEEPSLSHSSSAQRRHRVERPAASVTEQTGGRRSNHHHSQWAHGRVWPATRLAMSGRKKRGVERPQEEEGFPALVPILRLRR